MEREIKFRAWNDKKIISWKELLKYYPNGESDYDLHAIFSGDEHLELMQYTGLKDKNGKEIYEGDIITCEGGYETIEGCSEDCEEPRVIEWSDGLQWVAECKNCRDNVPLYEWDYNEVIGNIYENPELLNN